MSDVNLTKPRAAFGLHLTLDGYGCDRAALTFTGAGFSGTLSSVSLYPVDF